MPGMTGYQVFEKMQESEESKNIPVIFMTAMGQQKDIAKGVGLGAVDYIVKPFKPTILVEKVKTALKC